MAGSTARAPGSTSPAAPGALTTDAAAHAALLAVTRGAPGIYNIAEDDGEFSIEKARRELGFDPGFRNACLNPGREPVNSRHERSHSAPGSGHNRSPLAGEIARRRTFAIISHPDAGKTTLTEKLLLFGGAIQLAGQVKAKRDRRSTRSDWMAIERERGISVVTSVMTFEYDDLRLQPARHAGPRGLLRGHLPDADRGRFRRDGDRRRQGHRGAHPQAVRGLPAARHPDHHLHQQDGPREPRSVRPARRDREDAGARHRAGDLAGRPRPRFRRHHRGRGRRRAPARRRRRQGRHACAR